VRTEDTDNGPAEHSGRTAAGLRTAPTQT